MTLKTIIAGSLLTASSAALAWTPYYGNGWGNNGNFIGDGNFGFSMNANARGNGNGWGNGYNGYRPYYGGPAYYGPALSQDQIEAQQKAQADYFKKMEEQRKAYFEAQQKAQEEYAAMMEKRYGNKK